MNHGKRMNMNSYKIINREITLKNQELKTCLSLKTEEFNRVYSELLKCREENQKLRTMVIEVIQKNSAEYNRLIMALTAGDGTWNEQQLPLQSHQNLRSSCSSQTVVTNASSRILNQMEFRSVHSNSSSHEALPSRARTSMKSDLREIMSPPQNDRSNIDEFDESIEDERLSHQYNQQQQYDEEIDKENYDDNSDNERYLYKPLSVLDEMNESLYRSNSNVACITSCNSIRNNMSNEYIDNDEYEMENQRNYVTVARGKRRTKVQLMDGDSNVCYIEEDKINKSLRKSRKTLFKRKCKKENSMEDVTPLCDNKSQTITIKGGDYDGYDDTVIDMDSLEAVASSTPYRLKKERRSTTNIVKRRSSVRLDSKCTVAANEIGRPRRRAATKNYREPSINTKMRKS